jgi:predicted thioesterase
MLMDKKNLGGCLARSSVQLLEADVLAVLPEALAAHVEAVLSDQTVTVGARAAEMKTKCYKFNNEIQNSQSAKIN